MHMLIHANAFVGDEFRFLGLDLITLNCTLHGSLGFWKEGRKEEWISVLWTLCSWYNPSSSGVLLNTLFFFDVGVLFWVSKSKKEGCLIKLEWFVNSTEMSDEVLQQLSSNSSSLDPSLSNKLAKLEARMVGKSAPQQPLQLAAAASSIPFTIRKFPGASTSSSASDNDVRIHSVSRKNCYLSTSNGSSLYVFVATEVHTHTQRFN